MHSLIDIFAYKIYKEKLLSNGDIRKMKYAKHVIWNELVKFLALLIIFKLSSKLDLFLFCIALLLPIRIFSGGLHFKNTLSCFIASLIFFSLAILILPRLFSMTVTIGKILMLISTVIIYVHSPIPSSFRPILNEKRKQNLKYISVFFTLLSIFILFKFTLTNNKVFFESGIWVISIQAFQLILGKELN